MRTKQNKFESPENNTSPIKVPTRPHQRDERSSTSERKLGREWGSGYVEYLQQQTVGE